VIVVAASIVAGCGSPRSTVNEQSTVENAVALYIAGDYENAEVLFEEVLDDPDSDEDLLTAHLYLGRIYLAENEYQKAANVLSTGKALGGDARFDEYFAIAASHLRASSSQIIQEDIISRGQLAALLKDMFGEALKGKVGESVGTERRSGSDKEHWADAYVYFAETSGMMTKLPDGSFHPDAKVTRPAFFVVVCRLTELLGLPRGVRDDVFPGGLRDTIESLGGEHPDHDKNGYVSGRDAKVVLNTVAKAAGLQEEP